jgi:D-glycero-alpha-D-manno-heptose-7-phosphate kinase
MCESDHGLMLPVGRRGATATSPRFLCFGPMHARAPLRIDLAGGWSDIPPFARAEGGAVVSVAVSPHAVAEMTSGADGVEVRYRLDLPSGTGLGSSASLTVAWLALMRRATNGDGSAVALADGACRIAETVGVVGGRQDQYAAAIGGVNLFRFDDEVHVEPILREPEAQRDLAAQLVVCNSGVSRLSGDIHDAVWGAYLRGDTDVAAVLRALRDTALELARALAGGDTRGVLECINHNWELQQRLHPSVTNDVIERLVAAGLDAGAQAAKACGAGGGGCVVFVVSHDGRRAVADALRVAGGTVIDVAADSSGVLVDD